MKTETKKSSKIIAPAVGFMFGGIGAVISFEACSFIFFVASLLIMGFSVQTGRKAA